MVVSDLSDKCKQLEEALVLANESHSQAQLKLTEDADSLKLDLHASRLEAIKLNQKLSQKEGAF